MKSKITQLFQSRSYGIVIFGYLFIALLVYVVYRRNPVFLEGMEDASTTTTNSETPSTTSSPSGSTHTYYDTNTYNHYNKANTVVYYAPDGTTAYLTTLSNGTTALVVNNNVYILSNTNNNTYEYNGNTATVTNNNGQITVKVTRSDGVVTIYSPTQNSGITYVPNTSSSSSVNTYSSKGTINYTGPYGTTATVTTLGGITEIAVTFRNNSSSVFYIDKNDTSGTVYVDAYGDKAVIHNDNGTIIVTTRQGETLTYTKVAGTTGYSSYNSTPYTSSTSVTNTTTGNTAGSVTGPYDNTLYYANSGNVNGKPVTVNSVPPGDEDLYILKSQVVPPVCPVCPPPIVKKCDKEKECGPCPIQRCPTAPFKCVKEPDYSNPSIKQYLPIPVLNSFSSFGL